MGGRLPRPETAATGSSPAVARIEGVEATSIGRHRFRLSNGEVWEQTEPRAVALSVGDEVVVKSGLFGSHHMRPKDGSSRSVKVRPVE